MTFTARPLSLLIALALGSFALGAVTTSQSSTVPAAPTPVQALAASSGDTSVPPASSVTFPVADEAPAPAF